MDWIDEPSTGGASRFFARFAHDDDEPLRMIYQPKASKRDRDEGLEGMPERECPKFDGGDFVNPMMGSDSKRTLRANHHPTVKPTALR